MNEHRETASTARTESEAAARSDRYKRHLDEQLDAALEETFPASDPVAVTPRRVRRTQSAGADAAAGRA